MAEQLDAFPETSPTDEAIRSPLGIDFLDAVISTRAGVDNSRLHRRIRSSKMLSMFFSSIESCRRAYDVYRLLHKEVARRNEEYAAHTSDESAAEAESVGSVESLESEDTDGDNGRTESPLPSMSQKHRHKKRIRDPYFLSKDSTAVLIERLLRNRHANQALAVCAVAKATLDDAGPQIMFYNLQACYYSGRLKECVDEMNAILAMSDAALRENVQRSIPSNCFAFATISAVEIGDVDAAFAFIKRGWEECGFLPFIKVRVRAMKLFREKEHPEYVLSLVRWLLSDKTIKLDSCTLFLGMQVAIHANDSDVIREIGVAFKDDRFRGLSNKSLTKAIKAFSNASLWGHVDALLETILTRKDIDYVTVKTYIGTKHRQGDMQGVVKSFLLVRKERPELQWDSNMYAMVIDAYRSLKRYEDAFRCYVLLRKEEVQVDCRLATAAVTNIYDDLISDGPTPIGPRAVAGLQKLDFVLRDAREAEVVFDALMFALCIQCYATCGRWFEAEKLYKEIIDKGIRPTADHMRILLVAYWNGQKPHFAMQLYEDIVKSGRKDANTWWTFNVMLTGLRKYRLYDEAIALFDRAVETLGTPDTKAFNMMIDVYRESGNLSKALNIFWYLLDNMEKLQHYTVTGVLRCCVPEGRLDTAERILEICAEKHVVPNEGVYGVMLEVCRVAVNVPRAEFYLQEMRRLDLEVNVVHMSTVMCLYFDAGDVETGKKIFAEMNETLEIDGVACYLYVKNLIKAGLEEEAIAFVAAIEDDSRFQRCDPYHALVTGMIEQDKCSKMLEIFDMMYEVSVVPMPRTYAVAIEKLFDTEGFTDAAESLVYELMTDSTIVDERRRLYKYRFLMELFSKREEYERMLELFEEMSINTLHPSQVVCSLMLRAAFETQQWQLVVDMYEQLTSYSERNIESSDHRKICLAFANVGHWMRLSTYLSDLEPESVSFEADDFQTFVEIAMFREEYGAAYEMYNRGEKFNIRLTKKMKDLAEDCLRRMGNWEDANRLRDSDEEAEGEHDIGVHDLAGGGGYSDDENADDAMDRRRMGSDNDDDDDDDDTEDDDDDPFSLDSSQVDIPIREDIRDWFTQIPNDTDSDSESFAF